MEVFVIHKDKLQYIPPVISSCLILNELGYKVTLIDEGVPDNWKHQFSEKGITVYEIPRKYGNGFLGKLLSYRNFKSKVFGFLKNKTTPDSMLWIEGGQTINCLGERIKEYKYILQISELHEQSKIQMKAIGKVINEAQTVFMPEYNRAILYQVWYKMRQRPVVLPNKPYFIPDKNKMLALKEKYKEQLEALNGKKVIIFQGHIRNIEGYVKAIKEIDRDFRLVLVGHDYGHVKEWQKIDNSIVHINFIPAPDYLVFTSIAYIGILSYSPESLNNVFCAPNKIYEYSAFGVPMIGNDIPGLKFTIEHSNAGLVVDEKNVESIKGGLIYIDEHYDDFKISAINFYSQTDNKKIISNELKGSSIN